MSPARALRDLVHAAVERHLPAAELDQLRRLEREERRLLHGIIGMVLEQ